MSATLFRGRAAEHAPAREIWPGDVDLIAGRHGILPAHVWAIVQVEANGEGYLPDGRLKVLFEAHHFDRLTKGAHRAAEPTLSTPRWDPKLYWGGAAEHVRLGRAMVLDRHAALLATSFGAGQIMGFNHKRAGYADVEAMIRAFADAASAQVEAVVAFMASGRLIPALQRLDWRRVARGYNGPGYARNRYHLKLGLAFAHRSGLRIWLGRADDLVARLQTALKVAGHAPGAIDGALGPKTAEALIDYQLATGQPFPPEMTE